MSVHYLRYALALEQAAPSGQAANEIEHTIYARLTDLEELGRAESVEYQEQWELRIPHVEGQNALGGTVRVRKIQSKSLLAQDGAGFDSEDELPTSYVLTTKVKKATQGECSEVEVPTTKDNFTLFKFLSSHGMIKRRHRFPVAGSELCWEVDVYLKPDGSYHDWVKIDLEVKDLATPLPPFPVSVDRETAITAPYGQRTREEIAQIDRLFKTVFQTTNVYLPRLAA